VGLQLFRQRSLETPLMVVLLLAPPATNSVLCVSRGSPSAAVLASPHTAALPSNPLLGRLTLYGFVHHCQRCRGGWLLHPFWLRCPKLLGCFRSGSLFVDATKASIYGGCCCLVSCVFGFLNSDTMFCWVLVYP
jgi:hypothetical protein